MTGAEICEKEKCTGCMACRNICPRRCISMQEGKLGHLYPCVDQSLCVDCNLCVKVCPENKPATLAKPVTAFAGWHKDRSEYLSSTSGGAAAAISQQIIKRDGVVYGCSAQRRLKINHIRVDSLSDLTLLKGSKYVQSDIDDCYTRIKTDLKSGRTVLFIGTPCQCAGLQSYLGNDYENLYRVDLICHGVPSQCLLKRHISKVSEGQGDYVTFRKGNDMGLRVFDKDKNIIYYSNVWYERYKDAYYNTFIDGYTYRDSCYQCRYARPERCSDITIGDFWGLGDDIVHDRVNGCSCMLPVTQKGLQLIKTSSLELYERNVSEAVNGNGQLQHPKKKTRRIALFRRLYNISGLRLSYLICELDHIIEARLISPIKRRLKI